MAPYNISQPTRPHFVLGLADQAQHRAKHLNFTITMSGPVTAPAASASALHAVARRLAERSTSVHQAIYFMTEHPPNRDSRITLMNDSRDALNMPRVRLEMRHGELEIETLERTIELLARELGRLGAGRVQWAGTRDDWRTSFTSLSRHHMGATRMSTSPSGGVVDEYGRVHNVANLYLAGSSVFPTSGLCNPTLTLLALGYRMGDRLIASHGRTA
jgi:choline dehydrogenase-like flavoprotein